MLKAIGKELKMTEGDFGTSLPITITGGAIASDEKIKFYINDAEGNEIISPKEYTNIEKNTFYLSFTKDESAKLKVGVFFYKIDWYKEDVFKGNIIKNKIFEVERG